MSCDIFDKSSVAFIIRLSIFLVIFDHNGPCIELFQIYSNKLSKPIFRIYGAFTKNRISMKTTISQEPLVEIDPTLCQNVSCKKPL